MDRVLLVEDKESLAEMLREALGADQLLTDWARSGNEALNYIAQGRVYSAVLTDLRLPGADGIAVLKAVKEADPDCPVIVMTAYGTIENAVEAMRIGAYDFIQKPVDVDYLSLLLRRCREHRALKVENLLLREEFQKRRGFPSIIGESPEIVSVSRQIQKVAPTDSTVLLQGESGTGKELFARAIHQLSPRRERPFVAVNCAAIPETLIENELFGHERGAYTGAGSRQMGKFELAQGGTIFLDEIAELPFGVQAKVLRVLQEKTFERIGGTVVIHADVRIICATNRDLADAVKSGTFRDDLFFRINVFPITVPPLRARKGDLDLLTTHFLNRFAREMGRKVPDVSDEARDTIHAHDWPGNIRELENSLERAMILSEKSVIRREDLSVAPTTLRAESAIRELIDFRGSLSDVTSRAAQLAERAKIADTIRSAKSKQEAADRLGISVRTLAAKLKEHGFDERRIHDEHPDGT